jgi:hypothetical protein
MSASPSSTQAARMMGVVHLLGRGKPRAALPASQLAAPPARPIAAAPAQPRASTPVLPIARGPTLKVAPLRAGRFDHLATAGSFAHLAPVEPRLGPAPAPRAPPSPTALAAEVIASAEATRQPMKPPPPPSDPIARQVVESAALARTPRTATSMPSDPVARQVIEAGMRRRGELK